MLILIWDSIFFRGGSGAMAEAEMFEGVFMIIWGSCRMEGITLKWAFF